MCIKFLWIGIFIISVVHISFASDNDTLQISNNDTLQIIDNDTLQINNNDSLQIIDNDSIKKQINYLEYFVTGQGNWYSRNPSLKRDLSGLLHYVNDEKIDTILTHLGKLSVDSSYCFYRSPEDVDDSLQVQGYISNDGVMKIQKKIDRSIRTNILREKIAVPKKLLTNIDNKLPLVTKEDVKLLINNRDSVFPARLKWIETKSKGIIRHFEDIKIKKDTLSRKEVRLADIVDSLEKVRVKYNDNLRIHYLDSVTNDYRNKYIDDYSRQVQRDTARYVHLKNDSLLVAYNEQIIKIVNDSLTKVISSLREYAANDSVLIRFKNTDGNFEEIWTDRNDPRSMRLFIKNEQNDSLGIRIENAGKRSIRMFIDDGGVSLSRYKITHSKEAKLNENKISSSNLDNIFNKFKVESPWTLFGKTNLGFSQTGVTKWKSGGESAYSFLFSFYGTANYAKNNFILNNTLTLYDGWIKPGGERLQKNEDELDLASRIGYKAAKKWNYSAEVSFKSQLFNSYNYPNREDVISKFVSPVYVNLKLGMDFRPNGNFSLLTTPLSFKLVYINDPEEVNVSGYGIDEGKKTNWQPGLNVDLSWNKKISDDISYSTKYNLFLNYLMPTDNLPDMEWQSILTIHVNTFISATARLNLKYDNDVKFNVGTDDEGNSIMETRWQMKDIISIGFVYSLNKKIYHRKRIKR